MRSGLQEIPALTALTVYVTRNRSLRDDSQGTSLLGLIAVLLVFSTLSAALFSQYSTANFQTVGTNSSNRAYYLAESGFRYAAAKMAAGADLNSLHNTTFTLPTSATEQFSLFFRPHLFQVTGVSGLWLTAQVPYGAAPALADQPGMLRINSGAAETYSQIQLQGVNQVRFRRPAGTWTASAGDSVSLVLRSDGTTVTEGGDLMVQGATPADAFPAHNGRFTLNGGTYRYVTRESNRLRGITRTDAPWAPLAPANGDELDLQPFVRLESTGNFGQGTLGASRLITYHVPISSSGAPGSEWHETFDDNALGSWNTPSSEGAHAVAVTDGDNALSVTGTDRIPTTQLDSSQLALDWTQTSTDLASAWSSNSNYLNYDAQVKIRVDDEPAYLAGISFRLDNSGNHYGVSLLRAASDNVDGIPNILVPITGEPMILLWERDDPNFGNWQWLAYKRLTYDDQLFPVYFDDDMESGTAGWNATGLWHISNNRSHSPTSSWYYGQEGSFNFETGGRNRGDLRSGWIDLRNAVRPALRYWSWHETEDVNPNTYDQKLLQIQRQGTNSWTTIDRIYDIALPWHERQVDLSAYAGSRVRIRFRFDTRDHLYNDHEGWYVDDMAVFDQGQIIWPTLLVRIEEKTAVTGPFAGQRVNDIQVFFGDTAAHGTAGTDPLDTQRLANPRGDVEWPPDDVDDTDAASDFFTLVQWEANAASVQRMGSGNELNSIIRSNNALLMTPSSGSFQTTRPELGLHTWGWGSIGGTPNNTQTPDVSFDDFAIRLPGAADSTNSFLPALQE